VLALHAVSVPFRFDESNEAMSDLPAVLARAVMRRWLPFSERKRAKALREAFDVVRDLAIKNEERGFEASSTILNIALYILIAERDIQCLKIDALTHPDEWTRKLCARVILLTVHEWDLDKVSGRGLKRALDMAGASDEVRKQAVDALRRLRFVQRMAVTKFGRLRHTAIAHRDADALLQYRLIEELKTEDVFRVTGEFYDAARRFMDVLPRLVVETGTMPALLRQWLASNGNKG
jgi:hypothetical protein